MKQETFFYSFDLQNKFDTGINVSPGSSQVYLFRSSFLSLSLSVSFSLSFSVSFGLSVLPTQEHINSLLLSPLGCPSRNAPLLQLIHLAELPH